MSAVRISIGNHSPTCFLEVPAHQQEGHSELSLKAFSGRLNTLDNKASKRGTRMHKTATLIRESAEDCNHVRDLTAIIDRTEKEGKGNGHQVLLMAGQEPEIVNQKRQRLLEIDCCGLKDTL